MNNIAQLIDHTNLKPDASESDIKKLCEETVEHGFLSAGAIVEDVEIMRETVGDEMGVKASGGIKTAADVKAMVDAGANRIGTSSSISIIYE